MKNEKNEMKKMKKKKEKNQTYSWELQPKLYANNP